MPCGEFLFLYKNNISLLTVMVPSSTKVENLCHAESFFSFIKSIYITVNSDGTFIH